MVHRNARLTFHGRRLLVQRVREEGMPVAHAAKTMGVSRQCAHRWVARFDVEGEAGLWDRSSRPHHTPTRTSVEIEQCVLDARAEHRRGPDWIGPELGVAARTVTRVLRRHGVPRLCECDPLTGVVVRASKKTTIRYERDRPGWPDPVWWSACYESAGWGWRLVQRAAYAAGVSMPRLECGRRVL